MTKSSIKKGTLLIIAFSVAVFVVISLLSLPSKEEEERQLEAQLPHWEDSLTNSGSDVTALRAMDEEFERFMARWEITGMSLAVTRNDSLLYAKGFGYADREKGVKMQPSNIMRIASVSKLVTAVGVMHLIDQGKLSLDSRCFGEGGVIDDPELNSLIKDPRLKDITVRDLLLHQAGFQGVKNDPMFRTADLVRQHHLNGAPDPKTLMKILLGRRLSYTPGSGRRYSNAGYFMLSMVLEKAAGKDYWKYMTEDVLRKMGCYSFRPATNYYGQKYPDEVRYYNTDEEPVEEFNGSGKMVERVYGGSDYHGLMGAGGWLTSPSDLARMVASIDGDPTLKDFLSKKSIDTMTAYSDDEKLAMGWVSVDKDGKWTRTGTLSSTAAIIERFPDGECWVVVTNTGSYKGFKFSKYLSQFIDRMREKYGNDFPRRNLFK